MSSSQEVTIVTSALLVVTSATLLVTSALLVVTGTSGHLPEYPDTTSKEVCDCL